MPTFDLAKLLPYIIAALAVAGAIAWFVAHDRAVAREAIATDRADANARVIDLQIKSINDKQKVIDLADELSKVRYAETVAANKAAAQYRAAYNLIATDPDVARVLGTRLPESLRQLRRANTAAFGGGDRVPVLHAPGVAAADAGTGPAGRDGRAATGREPPTARATDGLQPGQGQSPPADRQPEAAGRWWNPMSWFGSAPNRSAP